MEVKDRGGGGGRDGSSGSGVWDCGSTSTVVKMRRGSGEGGRSASGASRGRLMDPQHNMPQLQETIIIVYPSLRYELEVTKEWGYKQFRYFCNGSLRYKDRWREHAI
uniref:Uncharacterized protein n=1 Tax=Oryza nivara TaxID=4536 RepID=A0A0E0FG27_ORYNI